jgi:hypothetical protein
VNMRRTGAVIISSHFDRQLLPIQEVYRLVVVTETTRQRARSISQFSVRIREGNLSTKSIRLGR